MGWQAGACKYKMRAQVASSGSRYRLGYGGIPGRHVVLPWLRVTRVPSAATVNRGCLQVAARGGVPEAT